jgi:hypothetical protein
MKSLLTTLLLLLSASLYSQKLEAYGGLNLNTFRYNEKNSGGYVESFDPGCGPVFGIGIDSLRLDRLKFRFTLQYEMYSGGLDAFAAGHTYYHSTVAEIKKSILSLDAYPINFRIIKRIDLNFGVQFSILLSESIKGTETHGSDEYDLQDIYERYSSRFYCGLTGRIAYDFKLSDSFFLSPQYSFYYGLTKEFVGFPEEVKSMRHYFCIGIEKRLK